MIHVCALVLALMTATAHSQAERDLVLRWAPIPHTSQEGFFDDDTPDGNLLFQAGWGAGKTTTLWGKMLKLSALNAPLRGLWTVPHFGHIDETILPVLESTDPVTGEPWFLTPEEYYYHQTKHRLSWAGGGDIQFVSAEVPRRIAGPNVAFAGTDEPASIKHEAWRNTSARVRDPRATLRQKVAAGTPEGITYLLDYFGADRTDKYKLYTMSTEENIELIRHNPEFVTQMKGSMTEAEVLAYITGRAVNITGALAHPTFDADRHWLPTVPIETGLPLRIAFDFNVDPMSAVIGQQGPSPLGTEARVIDAVAIYGGATTQDVCTEIRQRYPRWPAGLFIYGDCNGNNRSTVSNKTNYQIIKEQLAPIGPLTMRVPTANPPVKARLNAVNRMFRNALGQTRLYIRKTEPARDAKTRVLVLSLQKTKIKAGTDDIEKKSGEVHTHHGEALGYWIAYEFPIVKPGTTGAMTVDWL